MTIEELFKPKTPEEIDYTKRMFKLGEYSE